MVGGALGESDGLRPLEPLAGDAEDRRVLGLEIQLPGGVVETADLLALVTAAPDARAAGSDAEDQQSRQEMANEGSCQVSFF